jgi:CheY-like chemotaxis protein/Tfp pilus assembly protein PilZ
MPGEENRKFPRCDINTAISFKVPTKRMDISMASIKNISGGGLCFVTNVKMEMNQTVSMEFGLTEKDKITTIGKVVWIDPIKENDLPYAFQIGVKFVQLHKKEQEKIARFVITRLKERVKEELSRIKTDDEQQRRYSLLIIDDDKVTLELVREVFCDEFTVVTASDGTEGIQKAREWRPDLILLDIIMPDLDGFSTLMLLKDIEETKDIPVMMLSVVREKSKIFQAIREGAQDFILKPFTAESLLQKIKKTLYLAKK